MKILHTDRFMSGAPVGAESFLTDVIQALPPIRPSDLKPPAAERGEEKSSRQHVSDTQRPVHHRHTEGRYTKAARGWTEEGLTVGIADLAEPRRAQQHTSCVPQEGAVVQQPRQQGPVEPRQDVVSAETVESRRVRGRQQFKLQAGRSDLLKPEFRRDAIQIFTAKLETFCTCMNILKCLYLWIFFVKMSPMGINVNILTISLWLLYLVAASLIFSSFVSFFNLSILSKIHHQSKFEHTRWN